MYWPGSIRSPGLGLAKRPAQVCDGFVLVKSSAKRPILVFANMKVTQASMLSSRQLDECRDLSELWARMRLTRKMKQADAAVRARLSRNTKDRSPGVPCVRRIGAPDCTRVHFLRHTLASRPLNIGGTLK